MNQLSYRDPDGFIIKWQNKFFRVILEGWDQEIELLRDDFYKEYSIPPHFNIDNGVYDQLIIELNALGLDSSKILTILEVEGLKLITYPWEWTPSMLIDAGIYTLELQKRLMEKSLTLKDATFFNIQFVHNNIFFIDLLSIKKADTFYPWIPFGQFLRHFIYPAALLKYKKISNLKLFLNFTDGVSFDYLKNNLPKRSVLNVYQFFHFTVNKFLVNKNDAGHAVQQQASLLESKQKLANLIDWNIDYLKNIRLSLTKTNSFWSKYYLRDVAPEYNSRKIKGINTLLESINIKGTILDIGANTGEYSELYYNYSTHDVISLEVDTKCCEIIREKIVKSSKNTSRGNWYVINSDIINPDPSIGFMNKERESLLNRIKSSVVSALGITHHIYFTDSIDFNQQAILFYELSYEYLIIEFIYPDDDKVQKISLHNQSRFSTYTRENFLSSFSLRFDLINNIPLNETRELFLFNKHD